MINEVGVARELRILTEAVNGPPAPRDGATGANATEQTWRAGESFVDFAARMGGMLLRLRGNRSSSSPTWAYVPAAAAAAASKTKEKGAKDVQRDPEGLTAWGRDHVAYFVKVTGMARHLAVQAVAAMSVTQIGREHNKVLAALEQHGHASRAGSPSKRQKGGGPSALAPAAAQPLPAAAASQLVSPPVVQLPQIPPGLPPGYQVQFPSAPGAVPQQLQLPPFAPQPQFVQQPFVQQPCQPSLAGPPLPAPLSSKDLEAQHKQRVTQMISQGKKVNEPMDAVRAFEIIALRDSTQVTCGKRALLRRDHANCVPTAAMQQQGRQCRQCQAGPYTANDAAVVIKVKAAAEPALVSSALVG